MNYVRADSGQEASTIYNRYNNLELVIDVYLTGHDQKTFI